MLICSLVFRFKIWKVFPAEKTTCSGESKCKFDLFVHSKPKE